LNQPAITFLEQTGSTNADLAAMVRAGTQREAEWLVARRQVAGRGRQGREWFDGAGNFMGSTAVTITSDDPPPATLSFVAALAVHDAVEEAMGGAAHAALKWPNDVLVGGAKLAGILLEMVRGPGGTGVIVGIGVNLARAPDLADRKTVALARFGPVPALEHFADTLAGCFAARLANWRSGGLAPTLAAFEACSIHVPGAQISVHDQEARPITGAYAGLDRTDGALRLRLADGSERVIRAGDIS
jgi:BirA family biotin operon repressor/biotin-[acetyl-CoA-carboxylase] ligase